jgi:thiamine pyrophosphate-dependent acetolactate synthase large subunit-like protein
LENEGVERIFGIPGEENLDVVESLRRSSIKLIVTRHEQAAAFMAATQGRLAGRPGVCLATLGPGALNFTNGAACALGRAREGKCCSNWRKLKILADFWVMSLPEKAVTV